MRVTEGGIDLEVPGESTDGVEEAVFYNPRQELNRDLTIATLRAYREREPRAETYLDAMTASGVRGIRAAVDGWDVTCCDRDPEAVALARENAALNGLAVDGHAAGSANADGRETDLSRETPLDRDVDSETPLDHDVEDGIDVVRRDANALAHESTFDVIDLDPFGTPIPFADAAFANARNLVCVTATDTAPLCGAHFDSGVRSYSAVPRNTDYHPEMGVRILLSALARTAARYDVGVAPLLTHATSHYVRTYLELDHGATVANATIDELGHLSHCEDCLYREADPGLIADPLETCPNCGGDRLLAAGPIWLGPVRDREFVAAVRAEVDVAPELGTADRADRLLETLATELDEPTHYDQHRLCKEWGRSAAAMDEFLAALRSAGFSASRAHYSGTTFKTDANVEEIRTATATDTTG